MAESVKLSNGDYIDAEGVYDATQGKSQADINANIAKPVGNSILESYDFPLSNSEIVNSSHYYIVQNDGYAFLGYVFSDEAYSQFALTINRVYMFNQNISVGNSAGDGRKLHVISFPVKKGTSVMVSFYQNFTMAKLRLEII
jgi:hypothetical protein